VKAIVSRGYGPPDRLELRDVDKPELGDDGVLVRVRAASVNPYDWHMMRGHPYLVRLGEGLRRPKTEVLGVDVAGEVEAVGAAVTELRPGDEIFGGRVRAFAEYVCGPQKNFVLKPAALSFEEAASIPVAACTALQALRDHGELRPGQRVLINGAAGGVGTFAVQIAKAMGGVVTGVCSTRNLELVRSLGADHLVDYTAEDFSRSGRRYDLVVDLVGNRSLRALRRALTPDGTLVIAGGGHGRLLGPLALPIAATIRNRFVKQRLMWFMTKMRSDDLAAIVELIDAGKVTPVVERSYPLSEAREAIRHVEKGHARGKVVITV
jgi:NADPH:quinone reductase-like Zn-dependent oxidoreductase